MSVTIRSAEERDVPALGALAEAAGLFPADLLAGVIAPALAGGPDIWLIADDGDPVGFAFAEPERMADRVWNMLALGIAPDRQRRGIGAALTRALIARLEADGARLLIVETSSLPDQAAARAFYPALGFEREGTVRDFYADGEDKIVFRRRVELAS